MARANLAILGTDGTVGGPGGSPVTSTATSNAKSYYVSNSGSDSNNGLSTTAPWQTVGKVNSAALNPGDQVLFESGQTFNDTYLSPPASGTRGAPVSFGIYGQSGNAIIPQGAFWLDQHWLVLEDLNFAGTNSFIQGGNSSSHYANHIVIRHCLVDGGATTSSGIVGIVGEGDDWEIDHCTIQNTGDNGIYIIGDHWYVHDNLIQNVGQNASLGVGRHGIYPHAGGNLRIHRNRFLGWGTNGQAISLRYANNDVIDNYIDATGTSSTGQNGIAFFQDQNVAGFTRIVGNTVRGCGGGGDVCIYVPASDIYSLNEEMEIARNTLIPLIGAAGALDLRQNASLYRFGAGVNYAFSNPSFESGTTGWTTTSSWFLATGATLTQHGSPFAADGGSFSGEVVATTGAASEGAELSLGVIPAGSYVSVVWAVGNAGGEAVTLYAGPHSSASKNRNFTLTTTYQQLVLPFVSDGVNACFVGVGTQTASAYTFFLDAVEVWAASV